MVSQDPTYWEARIREHERAKILAKFGQSNPQKGNMPKGKRESVYEGAVDEWNSNEERFFLSTSTKERSLGSRRNDRAISPRS